MMTGEGFRPFVKVSRARLSCSGAACRIVSISDVVNNAGKHELATYLRDVCPLLYRDPEHIIRDIRGGHFLTSFKQTLARLPNATTFRESHLGEVVASVFAEHVLNLRLLYSKLSLTTAENENPKKMDIVMYDPASDPIKFVLGEVKQSPKHAKPALHDKSCCADLFNSLNNYTGEDLQFDLGAASDRMQGFDETEKERLKRALQPYSPMTVAYAGFIVIDSRTKDDAELSVLATRKNTKDLTVDVLCMERWSDLPDRVYSRLEELKKLCSP